MDRRQIAMSVCATSAACGAASLLASLEPALSKNQPLLAALGSAGLFGGAVGFLVLFITAPTSGTAHTLQSGGEPPSADNDGRFILTLLFGLCAFALLAAWTAIIAHRL